MAPQRRPGPNATIVAHALVGAAGSTALHAMLKPKTSDQKLAVPIIGAIALIWLHNLADMPVAHLLAAITA